MLELQLLPDTLAIVRLEPHDALPSWAVGGPLVSVTRTGAELSVVCLEHAVPPELPRAGGWRCLAVQGPLDFSLTGILASLAVPLAAAGTPVFVISTYDTDYLLVRAPDLDRACEALAAAGHRVEPRGDSIVDARRT